MFDSMKPTMKALCACFGKGSEAKKDVTLRRKMVIVGDGACGKTSLVTRMCSGQFVDIGYIPTVFETDVVSVSTGQEEVDLVIFDTAGQEDYDRLRPFSYSDVDAALICFSLDDPDSLTNVQENWSPEIRYFCGDVPVILVGNKKDLRDAESSARGSKHSLGSMSDNNKSASLVNFLDSMSTSTYNKSVNHTTENRKDAPANESTEDSESPVSPTRPLSSLYPSNAHTSFPKRAPVKHNEGVLMAKRIGAMAYFETSALTGDYVEELLLATTKAAVLGTKKSKKFKPFINTMNTWKSSSALSSK